MSGRQHHALTKLWPRDGKVNIIPPASVISLPISVVVSFSGVDNMAAYTSCGRAGGRASLAVMESGSWGRRCVCVSGKRGKA